MDEGALLAELAARYGLSVTQRVIGDTQVAMVNVPIAQDHWECVHGQGKTRVDALKDLSVNLDNSFVAQELIRRRQEE